MLGWGGFWAWDPVENASLLPWLTATAFIHSVIVQERRGMLRVWNLSLVIATFCLTILGTFLTRSGVIDSVHAFTQSDIGPWLLAFLGVVAATGIGLVAWRGDELRAPGRIDSAVSRESAFLANNLLFAALAFVVLLGTVFPLIAEALRGSRLSVGEPYFDRMATPIGLALLFLMAVGAGAAVAGDERRGRTQSAPRTGVDRRPHDAGRGHLRCPRPRGGPRVRARRVRDRRDRAPVRARDPRPAPRARRVARRSRSDGRPGRIRGSTAGLVVHFGVVLIAVVLAASSAYGANRDVKLRRDQSATVSGYTLTYLGSHTARSDQKVTVSARIRVAKGDRVLGTYSPAISTYPNSTEGIGTPSVHTGVIEDVYLTLVSSPNAQQRITLGVRINPMIVWLWIGGGFMALGTILALSPRLRRRKAPSPTTEPVPEALEEVTV